ncbi:MAG TPA: class I lanthipeptide [Thermoanaerobaculia bacterium]|jgi:hypothetical protein|nr:class I lanthipeptide [Thermoanaerobaculia bacterium]
MKKNTPKKLMLSRETVGRLAEEQAKLAQGGGIPNTRPNQELPWTSDSVKACCA